jgi:hypothetical protein
MRKPVSSQLSFRKQEEAAELRHVIISKVSCITIIFSSNNPISSHKSSSLARAQSPTAKVALLPVKEAAWCVPCWLALCQDSKDGARKGDYFRQGGRRHHPWSPCYHTAPLNAPCLAAGLEKQCLSTCKGKDQPHLMRPGPSVRTLHQASTWIMMIDT